MSKDELSITREVTGTVADALEVAKDVGVTYGVTDVTKVEVTPKTQKGAGFAAKEVPAAWTVSVTGRTA